MLHRMGRMPLGDVGVVGRTLGVAGTMQLGRLLVMPCGLLMVFRRFLVMLLRRLFLG